MSGTEHTNYIIVGEKTGPSQRPLRHQTGADALREATRLANVSPGERFVIYAAITGVEKTDVTITQFTAPDHLGDDIPF